MEDERKKCIDWIKEHKKELIFIGVSIATLIFTVMVMRKREAIKEFWNDLKKQVEKITKVSIEERMVSDIKKEVIEETAEAKVIPIERAPHPVVAHIRNLSEGRKASPQKIITAEEHGYHLQPGQTWVKKYRTGGGADCAG